MTTLDTSLPIMAGTLPARGGLGLKPEHFRTIFDTTPDLGFFEIHAENYMVDGGPFHHYLSQIRSRYPLSIHGVGLSIGSESRLDEAHLDRLATLLQRYLRVRAYHAADLEPVRTEAIAAALGDEAELPFLNLSIHPAVSILDSTAAIVSLWAAHQGIGDLAAVIPDAPETALVLRDGLDVEVMQIPRAAGAFIASLKRGAPLGESLVSAQWIDPGFDATASLALLIQISAITALHFPRRTS